MSNEKEGGISTPLNEIKDRKYGIGITRFFKVLGKDETRPKPCLNPIEHMKFVNKSPGKQRKRTPASHAKRRKNVNSGVNSPLKNKTSNVEEAECKTDAEPTTETLPRKAVIKPKRVVNCKKVSVCKRRLRNRGGKSSEDVSKESSDPYSVDDSEDSDLIISYSAFLKDTLLKKKPTDQNEDTNDCKDVKTTRSQSQRSITKYFSMATPMQNGSTGPNNVSKKKKKRVLNRRPKNRSKPEHLEVVDEVESGKSLKRSPRKSGRVSTSAGDVNDGGCQTNLRRSSRLRKPVFEHLSIENYDDESVQSNDGLVKEKYACKVSVIDEKDGKQSIKLRLTRISDKCKKSKAIVEKAQKLIRKSKRRAAMNQAIKVEPKPEVDTAEIDKSIEANEQVITVEDEGTAANYPVASIFLTSRKSSKCLPKLDEATIERRKQFLRSSIPESLQQQMVVSTEDCPEFLFPTIGHITQSDDSFPLSTHTTFGDFQLRDEPLPSYLSPSWQMGAVTNCRNQFSDPDRFHLSLTQSLTKLNNDQLPKNLEEIQEKNPSMNVSSTYNSYASRKDPSYLSELHTMKKRPFNSVSSTEEKGLSSGCKRRKTTRNGVEQIVEKIKQKSIQSSGDETECVNVLLSTYKNPGSESRSDMWTSIYQPETSSNIMANESSVKELKSFLSRWSSVEKRPTNKDRNYDLENSDSSNSYGSSVNECKAALLIGPSGCGKTVAVYAIARELGFKVLEINASSKRTSKLILSQLQEATQSHRVKEATIQTLLMQPELAKPKQEMATMSLILFEDVDIVFMEDEGFWSAVNEFISTTKIPVVLTTSDMKFRDKCYIKGDYETYILNAPDLNSQVVQLQILCLTDYWHLNSNDVYKLVSYNRNNFRRSVLFLQYLCNSESGYREAKQGEGSDGKLAISDYSNEVSSFSYEDSAFHRDVLFTICKYLHFAKYQNDRSSDVQSANGEKSCLEECHESSVRTSSLGISALVRRLEDLCVLDCFPATERSSADNFRARILDGVDDKERISDGDWFTEKLTVDIQDAILSSSYGLSYCKNYYNGSTDMAIQKKLGDVICQSITSVHGDITHSTKCKEVEDSVWSHINVGHGLNARAFSLDLLPSLRAICRSEKDKQAVSNKRSGRFLHYLSSNSIYLEPFTISELCKHLGPDNLA